MYKCKHFRLEELVSKIVFEKYGERAWSFFDPNLLKTLDDIREHFKKPIDINNWKWGGNFHQRGLRANCDDIVKKKTLNNQLYISEHILGRAFDFDVRGYEAEEVRREILKNNDKFPYIRRIEDNVSWVHIDGKPTGKYDIYLFKA